MNRETVICVSRAAYSRAPATPDDQAALEVDAPAGFVLALAAAERR